MKQKIGIVKQAEDPISDLDVVFCAVYNLLYEKLEAEPNKGIVVSKGSPNQRKETWESVLLLAHMVEDYLRIHVQGDKGFQCDNCSHWRGISNQSPHIGECSLRKRKPVHKWYHCKKFQEGS